MNIQPEQNEPEYHQPDYNDETGFLAEVGDHVDFADKVEILLNNSQIRNRLTENGYQYLKDNYTKEVIGKKMFD